MSVVVRGLAIEPQALVDTVMWGFGLKKVTPPPATRGATIEVGRVVINPKYLGETITISSFDFISRLLQGETISTAVVTNSVYTGVDPTPSAMINGAASFSGSVVSQSITGGVVGVIYALKCTITTSGGQTLQLTAYFAVIPDVP